MSAERRDIWAAGDRYERYVGRWSRLVARDFIAWLDPPPRLRWLDVGCGTAALSAGILAAAEPEALFGVDPSEGFLVLARAQTKDARVRFEPGDAQSLPLADGTVDAAVSGLVLNFVPDQPRALREMVRVVRHGGTVALYVWDYAGEMQLMRHFWDAAAALDPEVEELDEGTRFPICRPEALARLFRDARLEAVATRPIDVPTVFADFDDFWSPFLGGQGPAPAYCMSLPEERRAALRERLRATLPAAGDGHIALIARAWAVRGIVA
ncbi:MAG TPA: methyltransferase domain-containing protein [Geminicoccaceae bacterium]|nr:methyltransferase domain-containing protein [Geminicoccaceae bacterium]